MDAAVQTKSEETSHESVLQGDPLLNEAALRARVVYVANQHGIALVHPLVVGALEVAAEMLLARLLRGMVDAAEYKALPAKDIPGFVKDPERNWEREVRRSRPRLMVWLRGCAMAAAARVLASSRGMVLRRCGLFSAAVHVVAPCLLRSARTVLFKA